MKNAVVLVIMLLAPLLMAQKNTDDEFHHPTKNQWEHVTVHGCINRLSGYYILRHTDVGSPYLLDSTSEVNFDQYVGQHVEILGSESSKLSSSKKSPFKLPTTMIVHSISSVLNSKRCTH